MQLASCVGVVQEERFQALFSDGISQVSRGGVAGASVGGERFGIHMCCWQWDETGQRLRCSPPPGPREAKASRGQVNVKTMMLQASMHRQLMGPLRRHSIDEPLFNKALVLDEQKSDHLLEALLRRLPVPFESLSKFQNYANKCDALLICWVMDRASVNYVVSRYFFGQIHLMPSTVLGHCEPCAAHGFALVKGRAPFGERLGAILNSLSRLLRTPRFADVFRDALLRIARTVLWRPCSGQRLPITCTRRAGMKTAKKPNN